MTTRSMLVLASLFLLTVLCTGCRSREYCTEHWQCGDTRICDSEHHCVDNRCGDGIVRSTEACDDGNSVGGDGCSATCQTEACGNGVIDVGEECEYTTAIEGCDGCMDTDGVQTCGNGILETGEQCDDGNTADGDGCTEECYLQFDCGDGVCDSANGETCALCPEDCC